MGYDYLNTLNGIFVSCKNEEVFTRFYNKFIGHAIDFSQLVYDKKKLFAAFYMTSELNTLGYQLNQLTEKDRHYRDFTLNDLVTAVREVIASFLFTALICPQQQVKFFQGESISKWRLRPLATSI